MAKLNHTPLSTRPGPLKGLWVPARPHGPVNLVRNHGDRHYHLGTSDGRSSAD